MEKDEVREDLGGILTPPCAVAVEGLWRGGLAIAVDKDQLIEVRDGGAGAVAFDCTATQAKKRPGDDCAQREL